MGWFLVVVAGLFETGFAVLLKQSHHFTQLWPTVGFAACALISFGLLSVALRWLEVGPAYAVWTGIGAAGTAALGMIILGETVSAAKVVSIGLILAGVARAAGLHYRHAPGIADHRPDPVRGGAGPGGVDHRPGVAAGPVGNMRDARAARSS